MALDCDREIIKSLMTKRQADVQFKIILPLHNTLNVYDQKSNKSEPEMLLKIYLEVFYIGIIVLVYSKLPPNSGRSKVDECYKN